MFKFLIPALIMWLAAVPANAGVTITDDLLQTEFDVAGVTLGMTPTDAFGELESRGYKPRDHRMERGPSFNDLVNVLSGETKEGAVKSDWASALFLKGDEQVFIKFKPLPTGNGVSEVIYRNESSRMDIEKFRPLAMKKYGAPKFETRFVSTWSDLPLTSRNEADTDAGGISLEVNGHGRIKIILNGGKIGLFDAESEAENWSAPAETNF